MEADPQRPVDLEHKLHTSSRIYLQSVEGHSLITQLNNMAIMTQYWKKPHNDQYNGLHNTMLKHEHHTHYTVHTYLAVSVHQFSVAFWPSV